MQVHDAADMASRAETLGPGARLTQLHPGGPHSDALLAVDLLEIDPGGSTPLSAHAEEQVLFVISGTGEVSGASPAGSGVRLAPNSVVHIGHREVHSIRNTGREPLRVLVSTPLIVRSERVLGHTGRDATAERAAEPTTPPTPLPLPVVPEKPAAARPSPEYPPAASVRPTRETSAVAEPSAPSAEEAEEAPPDITGLLKKASEVPATPRSERRRPLPPEPEPEHQGSAEPEPQQAEEDGASPGLMELTVVFDGGSRGNPGQGYGSFMVQSPNRKPVIKRLEFGDNYTNNQAEYDSLIGALKYIVERLEATNRSPEQVQLDIKSDSDLVVNQLLGSYKVKDAGLKARHTQAIDLLDRFAAWMINWHERNESVRLLGH